MTLSYAMLQNAVSDTLSAASQISEKNVGENAFTVMIVTLIVWGGVFLYLLFLDRKVSKLDRRFEMRESSGDLKTH